MPVDWKNCRNSYDDVYSINTDANGNLYVAGYFDSPKLTFNNGIMLSSSGFHDGFIAKYNSDGVCQWQKKLPEQVTNARIQ
jgi:hypothetical protein